MNLKNEYKRLLFISIIVFIVLEIVTVLKGGVFKLDKQLLLVFAFSFMYTLFIGLANSYFIHKLDIYFAAERFSLKRIVVNVMGSFLITISIIFLLRIFEEVFIQERSFKEYISNENPGNYVVAIIITFFVIVCIYLFYFYKAYKENQVKEQKIIAGSASAQFESLKNQLDPHFLFNSLNVLSSLIEENPKNAQKFTTSLSKVYRYVLEQRDKELVTVEEELAFAKTYMNLLKMRFEDSITFELPNYEPNIDEKVVPLSLQLLLENCIKHNVVSEKKPLHITISVQNNYLTVKNNKQIKEVLDKKTGVGITNIVSRYAILSNRKVSIEEDDNVYKINLPILTKQLQIMESKIQYDEATLYANALKRVKEIKEFYVSLISYCIVIPALIFINYRVNWEFKWFYFPVLGWGLGLTFHAFSVFGYGKSWEERKIQQIMDKQNRDKTNWK